MLIDSHCHILSSEYDDCDKVIRDSFANGVNKIIINGYSVKSSIEAIKLAEKYPNVYAAIGIGPEEINDLEENYLEIMNKLSSEKKVVAIGEIGLDYYWTKDNKEKQIEVFGSLLEIARDKKLPVIVHSREASQDVYELLKKYGVNGIIHCFSSSLEMAQKYIKLGFLIGIGGVLTFKNSKKLKEIVEKIDLCNISLETDSPYLSPEPYRGQKSYPYRVIEVAKKIAEIKGIALQEVIEVTGRSVISKFDLN